MRAQAKLVIVSVDMQTGKVYLVATEDNHLPTASLAPYDDIEEKAEDLFSQYSGLSFLWRQVKIATANINRDVLTVVYKGRIPFDSKLLKGKMILVTDMVESEVSTIPLYEILAYE